MDFLVEMYNANSSADALTSLASLNQSPDTYPFVTATCYYKGKPEWEVDMQPLAKRRR